MLSRILHAISGTLGMPVEFPHGVIMGIADATNVILSAHKPEEN